MITDLQKPIIEKLLKGNYLLLTPDFKGKVKYKVYEGNMIPVCYVATKVVHKLPDIFKKDKDGRVTLNLSKVRQLHGKSWIKTAYKKSK